MIVMKNLRAKMFNRRASNPKSKPELVLKTLKLKPGQRIADIGTGGGYFSFLFSKKVGKNGLIYAVDINPKFLKFVKNECKKKGIENLKIVLNDNIFKIIPKSDLDLIFLRNVYHHITARVEYFEKMSEILNKNGLVAILDYNSYGTFSFHRLFGHYVPKERIIQDLTKAGYVLNKSYDFLPEQSFLIFNKKANGGA
jgi:ubiquinone/menaquinone biosynthesis C-methylase UbiE